MGKVKVRKVIQSRPAAVSAQLPPGPELNPEEYKLKFPKVIQNKKPRSGAVGSPRRDKHDAALVAAVAPAWRALHLIRIFSDGDGLSSVRSAMFIVMPLWRLGQAPLAILGGSEKTAFAPCSLRMIICVRKRMSSAYGSFSRIRSGRVRGSDRADACRSDSS